MKVHLFSTASGLGCCSVLCVNAGGEDVYSMSGDDGSDFAASQLRLMR
jgi:hypothetical protein